MYKVHLRHTFDFPSKWSDINPFTFSHLCQILDAFESGSIDYDICRLRCVLSLLDIEDYKLEATDICAENIYRLSELCDWMFSSRNDGKSLYVSVNLKLDHNLYPEILGHSGYHFSVSESGIVDTDLTAEQYADALALLQLYSSTHSEDALDRLFACLYCPKPYSSVNVSKVKSYKMDKWWKVAAAYNLRGILNWIESLPKYDSIFHSQGTSKPLFGAEGGIYSLAKAGYGDLKSINDLNLFVFLDLLLSMTVNYLNELKGLGLKMGEISEKSHLSLSQIAQLI